MRTACSPTRTSVTDRIIAQAYLDTCVGVPHGYPCTKRLAHPRAMRSRRIRARGYTQQIWITRVCCTCRPTLRARVSMNKLKFDLIAVRCHYATKTIRILTVDQLCRGADGNVDQCSWYEIDYFFYRDSRVSINFPCVMYASAVRACGQRTSGSAQQHHTGRKTNHGTIAECTRYNDVAATRIIVLSKTDNMIFRAQEERKGHVNKHCIS